MALVVMKFGGTSVGDIDRIKNVARRVAKVKDQGNDVVVVVSAMAGETDRLINLAKQLAEIPDEREMDLLLSSGERVSSALLAIALKEMGYKARSFTGRQAGFITDDAHTKARIKRIEAKNILDALKRGEIAVVAGFQGVSELSHDVTTLGRGGSDTTAVALAAALNADVCEIYTDVKGVYTADPRIVPNARKLARICFEEMLEMASAGAKVLQVRSVEIGMKYSIPIHVRSSFEEEEGTMVVPFTKDMEEVLVSAVTHDKNQARITVVDVPDRPGIAKAIFTPLAEANINVDVIVQNVSHEGLTDLSFTVAKTDLPKAVKVIEDVVKEIGAKGYTTDERIAKVSIVGVGMRSHPGVAAKMFETLANEGINILMISTSEIKVSCIIEDKYTELAVRALHDAFKLGENQ
ncbi:aspartate kinase [Thermosulfidibacter takaii ABI70S6]|uniref:Aspartokinase n=1 Tax=Thermosulfidibacter takaii (strain DSM 17441 / JCM 13301 / NBRC 103674 / ABI70S6) TaxID=1298851 RepID=A0A0S3QUP7_THET7|nr:aspartate kinase [Thermosulfidibacter takaii]BAT72047.1 aspartate kinase [Thermosulfidibacter takaii ABI70S6]